MGTTSLSSLRVTPKHSRVTLDTDSTGITGIALECYPKVQSTWDKASEA